MTAMGGTERISRAISLLPTRLITMRRNVFDRHSASVTTPAEEAAGRASVSASCVSSLCMAVMKPLQVTTFFMGLNLFKIQMKSFMKLKR